ncbi:MAG: serine/threonine protein kinase, partial [Planctomycetes bacterium]|nr:serine/threonine protein kinase [Planctomycetota bacterium]
MSDPSPDSFPPNRAPQTGRLPAGGPTPGAGFPLTPGGGAPTPGGGLPAPGRFEVLRELGRGGHGVVLHARDRASGRELAVKVLLGRGHDLRTKRFAREAELATKLAHPGIVTLVDADLEASPPWLAFALVPGAVSLAERWSRLSRSARLDVLLQVARSVGYAHAQGVVHRDLKPANVLVDGRGRAFLIDFGVATGADVERLTLSGAWVGTPYYMSPEQLRGRKEVEVGPPADVWALGVLLYEALTELRPFPGESVVELAERVTTQTPKPVRKLDATIDPRLEAVCARALARDPAERFPDGRAFAEALELALRAPGSVDRRWLVATAGLGVAALGLSAALLLQGRELAPAPA